MWSQTIKIQKKNVIALAFLKYFQRDIFLAPKSIGIIAMLGWRKEAAYNILVYAIYQLFLSAFPYAKINVID